MQYGISELVSIFHGDRNISYNFNLLVETDELYILSSFDFSSLKLFSFPAGYLRTEITINNKYEIKYFKRKITFTIINEN